MKKQGKTGKEKVCVDIIITAFNNKKIIGKCLESVKRQSCKNFRCIVVDDNSSDGTPELISRKYKWTKIIKKKKQTGPSISRNIGIRQGNAKFIATLDSDVVLERNWLSEQLKRMEEDKEGKIGILASKLLFAKTGKINSAGGGIRFPGIGYDIGSGKSADRFKEEMEVGYACSAAMLMRRSMIDSIGMFDDTYFYGHEDTDLGWRARLASYKVVYNPKAIAYHAANQTVKTMSESVVFHGTKNRIRSMIKNCNILILPLNLLVYFFITLVQIFISRYRLAKIRAWWWNAINISNTTKLRNKPM